MNQKWPKNSQVQDEAHGKYVGLNSHEEEHEDDDLHFEEEHAAGHQDTEGVWLISYADMMTLLMGFFALMLSMSSFDEDKFKEVGNQAALYFGGEVMEPFKNAGEAIQNLIKEQGLEKQVNVAISQTGITLTFEGTLFFNSGSFEPKEGAKLLMNELLKILDNTAADKKYVIEGHTDDTPISRGVIASNWELSGLRANAIARIFETYKFKREQILTIGLGETRPILPNRNETGEPIIKNQEQNRRVVIKVLDKHPI